MPFSCLFDITIHIRLFQFLFYLWLDNSSNKYFFTCLFPFSYWNSIRIHFHYSGTIRTWRVLLFVCFPLYFIYKRFFVQSFLYISWSISSKEIHVCRLKILLGSFTFGKNGDKEIWYIILSSLYFMKHFFERDRQLKILYIFGKMATKKFDIIILVCQNKSAGGLKIKFL